MADQINNTNPENVTPAEIQDILGLRRVDPYDISGIVTSQVEQPDFQEYIDQKIQEIDERIASGGEPLTSATTGDIDNVRVSGSGLVREAVMAAGASFGATQLEELSGFFNLLGGVDMSMAVPHLDVEFYDMHLFEYLKSLDNYNQSDRAMLYQLSKFLCLADFQTPQTFDIGNNVSRLFASSVETINQGSITTALRSFPADVLETIQSKFQESQFKSDDDNGVSAAARNVFSAINNQFGVKNLNDLMAPFVSLVGMEVETNEAIAFTDYFVGTITIKLHDVKMMPLLQNFLIPMRSRARVTFGWNHPNPRTIAGTLLNLKMTYDADIYDYDIKFEDNMEITFTLKFRSPSFESMRRSSFLRPSMDQGNIVRSDDIRGEVGRLEQLLVDIRGERAAVLDRAGPSGASSSVSTALNASASVSRFLALVRDEEDDFDPSDPGFEREFTIGSEPDAVFIQKLRDALTLAIRIAERMPELVREISDQIWRRGSIYAIMERASEREEDDTLGGESQRIAQLERSSALIESAFRNNRLSQIREAVGQSVRNGFKHEFAPLSEVLNGLYFNGLYRGPSGGFVQGEGEEEGTIETGAEGSTVMYFRSNRFAGLFDTAAIGDFLISKEEFRSAYEDYMQQTGKVDIAMTDLLQNIMTRFFVNRSNVNYGLNAFFDEDTGESILGDNRTREEIRRRIADLDLPETLADELESKFKFNKDDVSTGIEFTVIAPRMVMVDRRSLSNVGSFVTNVSAATNENIEGPTQNIFMLYDDNSDGDTRSRLERGFLDLVVDRVGRNTELASEMRMKLKKEAAAQIFPTVRLRKNNASIISDINVGLSQADAALETYLMLQAGYADGGAAFQAPGTKLDTFGNGFSFKKRPTVSLTSLGIPRLQVKQYFFLDFDSGTNLDNIYFIGKIKHSMAKGEFSTSMDFIFNEVLATKETEAGDTDNSHNAEAESPSESDDDLGVPEHATEDERETMENPHVSAGSDRGRGFLGGWSRY